jgi:hypothetical protein
MQDVVTQSINTFLPIPAKNQIPKHQLSTKKTKIFAETLQMSEQDTVGHQGKKDDILSDS